MKTIGDIQLLTIPEAAEVLGVHDHTIRRHIKEGKLPAVQLGRAYIKVSDICAKLGVDSIDLSKYSED